MYGLKPVPFKEKMLVTHRGLSGPAILQASSYWRAGDALVVDFAPQAEQFHSRRAASKSRSCDLPRSLRMTERVGDADYGVGHTATEVRGIPQFFTEKNQPQVLRLRFAALGMTEHGAVKAGLLSGLREPGARRDLAAVKQALRAVLPQRLADYLAEAGGPQGWSNAALEARELALHRWEFHPLGTEGFEKAEVTAGGVDTDGLQARTLEARAMPGLYFIGEVVDVTGQLGGFNFQWAWASGVAAGRAA
jgi:predicted flavoprotein YhiN